MRPSTALAAAAAGLLAWALLKPAPDAETTATGAATTRAPLATAPRALQVLAWSVPAAPPDAAAPVPPMRHHPTAAPPVELCGLGRVLLTAPAPAGDDPPDLGDLPGPIGEQALAQARGAMLARLRHGDARQRAIALLLARPPDEPADAARAWATELLGLARQSGLPELLHRAEPACAHQESPGACRLALVRERLRLEPDNAAHWAALADEDPAAGDEAWAGLLRARRWQERPQSLMLAAQAALPPDLPGYLRLALARDMKLRIQPSPSAGEGFVLERCLQPDPGRAAACVELALLLSQRSDSLRTLPEAAAVAQAAGLPADRVQALRREFHDLLRADPLDPPLPEAHPAPLSCARLQAWQQHLDDTVRLGELGALRQRRAGS